MTGETEDVEFDSVRQAKELFNQCRILFQKVWVNKEGLGDNINQGNKIATGNTLNLNNQKSIGEDVLQGKYLKVF